jgi:hypothetical protein
MLSQSMSKLGDLFLACLAYADTQQQIRSVPSPEGRRYVHIYHLYLAVTVFKERAV